MRPQETCKVINYSHLLKRQYGKLKASCNILKNSKDPQAIKKAKLKVETLVNHFLDSYYSAIEYNALSDELNKVINLEDIRCKYLAKCIKSYESKIQKAAVKAGNALSNIDLAKIKLATEGKTKQLKGKMADGVKWSYDETTKVLKLSYFLASEYISTIVDGVKQGWAWLCQKLTSTFTKEKVLAAA